MREHYATTNTDINGFQSPDQRHCPQIEECLVGIICGALPCLPMNGNVGYIENKCTRGSYHCNQIHIISQSGNLVKWQLGLHCDMIGHGQLQSIKQSILAKQS